MVDTGAEYPDWDPSTCYTYRVGFQGNKVKDHLDVLPSPSRGAMDNAAEIEHLRQRAAGLLHRAADKECRSLVENLHILENDLYGSTTET